MRSELADDLRSRGLLDLPGLGWTSEGDNHVVSANKEAAAELELQLVALGFNLAGSKTDRVRFAGTETHLYQVRFRRPAAEGTPEEIVLLYVALRPEDRPNYVIVGRESNSNPWARWGDKVFAFEAAASAGLEAAQVDPAAFREVAKPFSIFTVHLTFRA